MLADVRVGSFATEKVWLRHVRSSPDSDRGTDITAMVDDIAAVHANHFTVGELREIAAFYRQPVGQKLLEKGKQSRSRACR
jgi:hypothetical protein